MLRGIADFIVQSNFQPHSSLSQWRHFTAHLVGSFDGQKFNAGIPSTFPDRTVRSNEMETALIEAERLLYQTALV